MFYLFINLFQVLNSMASFMNNVPHIYFVEGNIGAGKTTLLRWLQENIPDCQIISEPLDNWLNLKDANGMNILEHFYLDPKKYAHPFQTRACVSRAALLRTIDVNKRYVFVERSVDSDRHVFAKNSFALGHLSEMEMLQYCALQDDMREAFAVAYCPRLRQALKNARTMYLRCSPKTALRRVNMRARGEESTISNEYLTAVHNCHEDWLMHPLTGTPLDSVDVIDVNSDAQINDKETIWHSSTKDYSPGLAICRKLGIEQASLKCEAVQN
jgi:deoxyguanosine kinase